MRTIKFRAFREGKMVYGIENDDHQEPDAIYDSFAGWLKLSNCPIMQFTGLHDKNGKEIYEGDILKTTISAHEFAEVYYDETQCAYFARYSDKSFHPLSEWYKRNNAFEVIGNVWKNPELIKSPNQGRSQIN